MNLAVVRIILLFICFCTYTSYSQAINISHYVEFAHTYGVIRYFSPNPYTKDWSESDWMKVCALLAHRIETQPLETVFQPLAPTLYFSTAPILSKKDTTKSTTPAQFYYYSGLGELKVPFLAKLLMPGLANYIPYYKRLSTVLNLQDSVTAPVPNRYYNYPVGNEKYLNIQHALPKEMFDSKTTHRLLTEAKNYWKHHQSNDKMLSSNRRFIFGLLSDKAVRIADLAVRWNIVRHFYPYYEEDNLDWDHQLKIYLQKAIQIGEIDSFESLLEWYDTINRFLNPIKDGHLFVRRDMNISNIKATYLPEYFADVETRCVNDTLLIRTEIGGKQTWRMLHTINGKPASIRLQSCKEMTNAATEAHRNKIAVDKLFSSSVYDTPFVIESSGLAEQMHKNTLYTRYPDLPVSKHEDQPIRKYDNGFLYIDATSHKLNEKHFLSALTPDIKKLCFDLRGLPSYRFEDILAHLISSDVKAPATEVPINSFPFQQKLSWRVNTETLQAKLPHVNLPAVFLCDAGTVSWGETILMIVRHYGLGTIIGQTTAGTTGDMTQFDLPLFPFAMTGMRMHCMDGEQHHAQGIVPDKIIPIYANDYITNYDRTLNAVFNILK